MPTRPTFQRAPRLLPVRPSGQVEIPAPPQAPNRPSVSLVTVIMPAVMAVAMIASAVASPSASPYFALTSVFSVGLALYSFFSQRAGYKQMVRSRTDKYQTLLASTRKQLDLLVEQQRNADFAANPDPLKCVARAEQLDPRLWERSPSHDDYLALRVGLGQRPFEVTVVPPRRDSALDADPLVGEAHDLCQQFEQLDQMPVCLRLAEEGAAGLVGNRSEVLSTLRALCLQLATHHAPDEVKIVAIYPDGEENEWAWLRWLPHAWDDDRQHRYLAHDSSAAHDLLGELNSLLLRRQDELAASGQVGAAGVKPLPTMVLLLGDSRLVGNEPALELLEKQGTALGACALFLADRMESLPQCCRAIVAVEQGRGRLIFTNASGQHVAFAPDSFPASDADHFARILAPVRVRHLARAGEIPRNVPFLGVFGVDKVDDLDVLQRWRSAEPFRSMAVPLGLRQASEIVSLDLHQKAEGPHGLVAGTTGSGKSELLQSLLIALAVSFHPHDVVFVIVDFKGGGTANPFLGLPHLVGTITNLDGNLSARALVALRSELERRSAALGRAGLSDVDVYLRRRQQDPSLAPLPHLVLVVDEFARLKQEQPEFVKEMIGVAQLGRSLGVHLILVMQNPSGVVDDQILANTNFRLCLRVAEPRNSQEVLRRPDAAWIPKSLPGRTYLQIGDTTPILFQGAYAGASYIPQGLAPDDRDRVWDVFLDGTRREPRLTSNPLQIGSMPTQLQTVVNHVREVAFDEGIQALSGPWLPPLPKEVLLESLRDKRCGFDGQVWQPSPWLQPVIGLVDNPTRQYQGPLSLDLGQQFHLAVYGMPGSGKTAFLQTLITSLAAAHTPAELNLYLLDFGGGLLNEFAPLPHVGAVLLPQDQERVQRLLRVTLAEIEARKERFRRTGVSTLKAYRTVGVGEALPAVVLMIDNFNAFISAYADALDTLMQISRDGGAYGIHLVLTASGPAAVRPSISENLRIKLALQLPQRADYMDVVRSPLTFQPAPVPGRGLYRLEKDPTAVGSGVQNDQILEFQTALPMPGDEAQRTVALRAWASQVAASWQGPRARSIVALPPEVPLAELVPPTDSWPPAAPDGTWTLPLGLDVETLNPVVVDLCEGPHFFVAGPPQSGKSTLLQSWILGLCERYAPDRLQVYLVDFRGGGLSPLRKLPQILNPVIRDDDALGNALAEIEADLAQRRKALECARNESGDPSAERQCLARFPALVMAVDDLDMMLVDVQPPVRSRLERLLRYGRELGFHLIVATTSQNLNRFNELGPALKEGQCGFILGSTQTDEMQVLSVRLPQNEQNKVLPQGQGYFVTRRGRLVRIKGATAQAGIPTLAAWVAKLCQQGRRRDCAPEQAQKNSSQTP